MRSGRVWFMLWTCQEDIIFCAVKDFTLCMHFQRMETQAQIIMVEPTASLLFVSLYKQVLEKLSY